ncbi:MAG TPA: hypothetical protein VGQ83_03450 [Polyangia bacterium]
MRPVRGRRRPLRALLLGVAAFALAVLAGRAGGQTFRPATFDLAAARAAGDLAPEVRDARVHEGVTVREVRFTSTAWDAHGRARAIRVQAFLAVPPGASARRPRPAVISAHGLGFRGTPEGAADICRSLDAVALSLSAPGNGASEGRGVTPAESRPLFETLPDVRGSWLYAYSFALLRAITFVQQQPEVDPAAVVLTGTSMGGVAVLIANGVDDRIGGVLAVSAAGGFAPALREGSWLWRLARAAGGLTPQAAPVRALIRGLDPLAFAGRQHGAVYLLTGAQDEFFPLDQAVATYRALAAPAKSLTLVPDYDHGWYFGHGCPAPCMPGAAARPARCPPAPVCPVACPRGARPPYCGPRASYDRQADFTDRWGGLLRALVARHAARPPRPGAAPPPPPRVTREGGAVVVRPAAGPAPRQVRLAVSDNGGATYGQFLLARDRDGAYRHQARVGPGAILFAEVEGEDHVVATSIPELPAGFRPYIRPFGPEPKDAE